MKISYIPPVVLEVDKQSWLTKAFQDALENAIVIPLKTALLNGWIKFISLSYAVCLTVAVTGIVCGALGIKKGYRVAAGSIIFYLILRLFSWALGWY